MFKSMDIFAFDAMKRILNMKCIRYLNLFEKSTGVQTKNCFFYNRNLIFVVPYHLMPKAIGENGANIKKLSFILGKRVRVVSCPRSILDAKRFVLEIVKPVTFKDLEVLPDQIIISASMQNKAALIGRNKSRILELNKIINDIFGREAKIV